MSDMGFQYLHPCKGSKRPINAPRIRSDRVRRAHQQSAIDAGTPGAPYKVAIAYKKGRLASPFSITQ